MKVVIIGSGNVATVLGRKILRSANEIVQVVGRSTAEVAALAAALQTKYTTDFLDITGTADIYIIAVSDAAIGAVASQLKLSNKVLVHTAAAVSKEVLAQSSACYGVLYPLQTLKKEVIALPVIPIVVDANNDETMQTLLQFAEGWADGVSVANDEERLQLHVAAVFVNNFTNHLIAVAEQLCANNSTRFNLLRPLMIETIVRTEGHKASEVQTGPAIRKDFETISKHETVLEKYPEMLKLYKAVTNSIIRFYDDGKK
jgi:predicted short-subunit dehydrogenase-like oxidoreductase (DUF2520 family)